MRLKQGEQYTFRLADHKIPFPKGVTKCDLQFKVKGIDYISKTIEDVKEHRDKLYCTFTNEDTANMPEGLISYTMTFAGEFIDETEFSGETYVETTMYMTTTEHCGGDCPELEREVELLTDKVAELNSQIDEKDIEIVQLKEDVRTAFDNGVADQKAKLESVTFTENGVFIREDGYDMVTVDVPSSDCPELEEEVAELTTAVNILNETINEKDAFITILNNTIEERDETITELNGTIAIRDNEIEVLTQEVNDAFDEGVRNQKSKLTSTTISSNGTYTREDGFNEVTVYVAGAVDLYANTNAMFADMMLKMATYEYVSMYEIRRTLGDRTYTIPEDSMAVVSSYERLEPFKTAGTYDLDEYSTFITLFSHNRNAIIETTGSKKKISLYNTTPRIYGSGWEEMHLYHTECSNITLGLKTYCHTQTPPTVNGVSVNATIYYPKGADYSSFIEQWGSVATILPFDY